MPDRMFWKAIAQGHYLPEGYTVDSLTPELLDYLSSPDAELRDEIAVEILTNWILAGFYPLEKMRELMHKWIVDLSFGIGEDGTNSVLRRSFAALMLSIIAFREWKAPFLTEEEIHTLLDKAIEYCKAEKDVRGYDEEMGWLHSPAHTADLLKFIARSDMTTADDHRRILDAVAEKVTARRRMVFVHSEYERLSWVVLEIAKREILNRDDFAVWIQKLMDVKLHDTGKQNMEFHAMYQNTKHFLRAVYFMLLYQEEESPLPESPEILKYLFEALKQFRT